MADPTSPTGPVFRLGEILARRKEEEQSYKRLATRITEMWAKHTDQTQERDIIDRRKLKLLAEDVQLGKNVVISTNQLRALDVYLAHFNQGLAHQPIFRRPEFLRTAVEGEEVIFLVGSKVHAKRVDLSQWDVLSVAEIQRGVNRFSTSVHFDLRDVLLDEQVPAHDDTPPWTEVLKDGQPSVICIGSPRSCHACESMLATMFGVTPFESAPAHDDLVPFHFVRPPDNDRRVPSRFVQTASELRAQHPGVAGEVERGSHALRIGDEVHLADRPDCQPCRTFGVIAVQRRAPGQVWTVAAGLNGAATHACALALEGMSSKLPPAGAGRSGVWWAVVEAFVREDQRYPGRGIFRVVRQRLLKGLTHWQG
jgi:hypothetical protein